MDEDGLRKEIKEFIDTEVSDLLRLLNRRGDVASHTLQVHLAIEVRLARLLRARLPNGQHWLKERRGFREKLDVAFATGVLPKKLHDSLRALNDVRNGLAHDPESDIGQPEIDRLGQTLGKDFRPLRALHGSGTSDLALAVFAAVYGELAAQLYHAERLEPRLRAMRGPDRHAAVKQAAKRLVAMRKARKSGP